MEDAQRQQDLEAAQEQALLQQARAEEIEKLEEFGEFLTEKSSSGEEENDSVIAEEQKRKENLNKDLVVTTKDYVAATLTAWNNCPTIVKKQLDKQSDEIENLNLQLREVNLKLTQRRTEMERNYQSQMKQELLKHKEKIESIYREKLDEEKRKVLKQRVEEIERLMKENRVLNQKLSAK